ncbi:TIGR03749 family integrating conjugative element protein [Pseudomonas sp. NS1(2017)]|uniref:TIGR03749 family integrating conjugative element protein n=1 Tax=Pseudomonas sp. NS1(2017) TaxID=2025658 RepID=UPI000BA22C6B|nr:TIGR03749 family integrating conjugative element protein [Pseudomonas sp. NS1(2017)]ASV39764.1 TIGR03749 family integrating conjugative element protein [Pseudomonas sp. NS1(2017)]
MRRLCFALPVWLGCAAAHAVEIMHWERLPLAVPLHVGQERIIFIDRNVRVGVPRTLTDALRIQSTGGALYLRASAPIAPTRLQLQDVRSGEIILIDIAATAADDQPSLEPVKIVKAATASHRSQDDSASSGLGAGSTGDTPSQTASDPRGSPLPVVLTRYAAQSLYAPLRTLEPLSGVTQIKQRRELDLSLLLPTQPIVSTLLGAWQLDDHIVTAVKLRNTSEQTLNLDPRALQGDFLTATFQHPNLGPSGLTTDTTVVYLVTRAKDLANALPPAISRIDAGINMAPVSGGAHEE